MQGPHADSEESRWSPRIFLKKCMCDSDEHLEMRITGLSQREGQRV